MTTVICVRSEECYQPTNHDIDIADLAVQVP